MQGRAKSQQGFTLILVLWVMLLLSLMGVAFARVTQSYMREARSLSASAKAEFAADAGVGLVAFDLIKARDVPRHVRQLDVAGSERACSADPTIDLFIQVQDTGGKINLNLADQKLLAALFAGLGASAETATRHADRIIDFRDRDDDRRVSGAERDDYAAAGMPNGPKNASFDAIEELHQVLGLDEETIAAIRPFVTLHSGAAGLDPAVTPSRLVALINSGLSRIATISGEASNRLPAEFETVSRHKVYSVTVTARVDGTASFTRIAEVEVPPGKNELPFYREWRRGHDNSPRDQGRTALPGC